MAFGSKVDGGGVDVPGVVDPEDWLLDSTIERYLFAMEGPVCVEGAGADDVRVVLSSWSEERTKFTRLRLMPAPKTRWSSRGRK